MCEPFSVVAEEGQESAANSSHNCSRAELRSQSRISTVCPLFGLLFLSFPAGVLSELLQLHYLKKTLVEYFPRSTLYHDLLILTVASRRPSLSSTSDTIS